MAALLALLPLATLARGPEVGDYRGVYVAGTPLLNANRTMPDAVYGSRQASGVYIRLPWAVIEPEPGRFDFTLLDREMTRAVAAGKRVSLSVIAGGRAPAWLGSAGIRTLRLSTSQGGTEQAGARPTCISVDLPLPWDPAYQAAFQRMWTAVSQHLRQTPGAWEALRIVKLTGVNRISEELNMPWRAAGSACGSPPPDDTPRWVAAGYRTDVMVEAWVRLSRIIAEAFPGKLLAQDILERNDFPPVGDNGAPDRNPPVKARIIAEGRRLFGSRFALQWNALSLDGDLAPTVLDARRQGTVIGWQTNLFRGFQGAGCNTNRREAPLECAEPDYAATLERGVRSGAEYLEVWTPDLARFPEAVRAADNALRQGRNAR
ncbi:beta-galactosidase [Roseomonas populi]|uniref:Beta-galactosidase n=1 Tax=Roseomonas populi TaxID=3121582 RepID=A0ABT1X6I6_9PROT|nr:beta-galactosidase [Roseomonas pecuniae]MCR0983698.1 beta-galactosidase [Roseomonas pecuniae]